MLSQYRRSRSIPFLPRRLDFASLQVGLIVKIAVLLLTGFISFALFTYWELQSLSMMVMMSHSDPMVISRLTLTTERLMLLNGIFALTLLIIATGIGWRSLKPLCDFSDWVTSSTEPYPLQPLPSEIKRLSKSWNALLLQSSDLKQQQRQFINNVSHELRSPLSLVYGYLQRTLKRSQNLTEIQQEALTMATSEAERMRLILQNLLDLARSEPIDSIAFQEPLLLNEVVRDLVEMMTKFEHRAIELELSPTPIYIQSNRDYWMQLLNHLVHNAIQFSDAPILVKVISTQKTAVIQIIDYGCGIAPLQQQAVFEPFYRVDPSRTRATGGTGLGLTIVKSLVEQMGGTITLDSALGRGSTFSLVFPIDGVKQ
ncbi:HAMP domain-containing sensor histidine kinase [Oscillatoria sp. FACHB-1406]|uniref:sensor histidine kinase n=1 Tax=Oscillatoria sp. FACHB-1406 TaxID=2692846 RepID=UPI0016887333|nr:HAMP domain-containing sensor histidine kinase [Oscillatoria sp. FACHB-1406]MBD2580561.1 HAMP domain-containing histidine kinase [Oscillatoria sp. FACHB-1406]